MGNKTKTGIKKRTVRATVQKRVQAYRSCKKKIASDVLDEILDRVETTVFCKRIVKDIIDEATGLSRLQCIPGTSKSTPEKGLSDNSDEYNFFKDSKLLEEYSRIEEERLEIEHEPVEKKLLGCRLVEINHFLSKALILQTQHNKRCTGGRLEIFGEKKEGLRSTFILKCNICDKEIFLCNEEQNKEKSVFNRAAVWGTLATGSTHTHLTEFLSILDVPSISSWLFYKLQRELSETWKNSLWSTMEEAGKKEYDAAVSRGDVDKNTGKPYITVYVDGGWSKRSYGHTYNACSGVAVIIGKHTGMLLFLGVRNKYCSICARANNKNQVVKEHVCFKNWTGSSSSMEQDIIIQGFNSSIEMHNITYKKFIADGDSSVYTKIKEKVSYGLEVQKVECMNHVLKNYGKSLYKIKSDTKMVPLPARKLLSKDLIDELVKAVQLAVYANVQNAESLREDIRNTYNHVFGKHVSCKEYLCDKVGDCSQDRTKEVITSGLQHHIHGAMNQVLMKANLLLDKETNNRAELFMSILVRFNMGKRLNLIQRDSFQTRAHLTGLKYNKGHRWHEKPWREVFKKSPGTNLKLLIERQERIKEKRKIREESIPRAAKRLRFDPKNENENIDYGPNIAEVYLSDIELKDEVDVLCAGLQVTPEEQVAIAKETVGQFENSLYLSQRMKRLTASNFGAVVKRKPTTSCDGLVKKILNTSNSFFSPAMAYGKKNEAIAISIFEENMKSSGEKVSVSPSGIFIDLENGFLAASPDGIINTEEIVEVKCSLKVAQSGKTLMEAVQEKAIPYMQIRDGRLEIKENHDYYYQIMGQLAITKANTCHFIVYTGSKNELFCQKIRRDDSFWRTKMLPKLIEFYKECLGPEIILGRRLKKLKCRDPPRIVEAKEGEKKKKK